MKEYKLKRHNCTKHTAIDSQLRFDKIEQLSVQKLFHAYKKDTECNGKRR